MDREMETETKREMKRWPSSSSYPISPCLRHRLLEFLLYASLVSSLPRPHRSSISSHLNRPRFQNPNPSSLFPDKSNSRYRQSSSALLCPSLPTDFSHLFAGSFSILCAGKPSSSRSGKVLRFEIGASRIVFVYLEDLLIQFSKLSKLGELVRLDVCIDIIDLLYETEETSQLFSSPYCLAASVLIAAYVISIPKQRWEFPLIPWVKFVTNYSEEVISKTVTFILVQVLKPEAAKRIKKVYDHEAHCMIST
ncbi:cyclin-J18-like [Canna indica]|uniref:Cyclin-J18-like n=1 Tax=Canna indica TaxID=4628 RepID=A0AAQ3KIN4_9LILI|nr:cyclin-J18-like [Canna indica]